MKTIDGTPIVYIPYWFGYLGFATPWAVFTTVSPEYPGFNGHIHHERRHVQQWKEHGERYGVMFGYIVFLTLYLWQNITVGYHRNKFEQDARDFAFTQVVMGRDAYNV